MRRYLIALMAVLSVVSCRKVTEPVDDDANLGKLTLTTRLEGDYVAKSGGETAAEAFDPQELTVSVLKYGEGGEAVPVEGKKWKLKDMPEKVGLDIGNYAVEAVSVEGGQPEVGDVPYFYGTQDFSIAVQSETIVDLKATIQDCKLSVATTEDFQQSFADWTISVAPKSAPGTSLFELNDAQVEKYMKAVPFVLEVSAAKRFASENPVWTKTVEIDNPQKADWYRISLSVDPVGTVSLTVTVDNTLTRKDVVIGIPNDDEDLGNGGTVTPNPDPEEPDPEEKLPTIAGQEGLDMDEVLVLTMDKDIVSGVCSVPVKIAIKAEDGGIQSLNVKIDSQEAWFMTAVNALFDGTNTFDLANLVEGSDAKMNLVNLGIIGADEVIKGKTEYVFDITGFMGMLMVNDPATNSYDFTLTVKDGNPAHLAVGKTLVVRIVK